MDWKILLTDGLDENGRTILRSFAQVDDRPDITSEALLQAIGAYDALIVRGRTKVTDQVFEAARRLKVVGRAGVGLDNIDLAAAKKHGVMVVNAPVSTSIAVAELTIGLMLALARDLPTADSSIKRGDWLKKQLEGVELYGKILGIIGLGNIGWAVAARAAAFGMIILGFDPWLGDEKIIERGATPVGLDELYTRADFITLHVPLTRETRLMIDRSAIESMKPQVRLICAARGGIIDEDALLEALDTGKVAGAGLDVFLKEPPGASALAAHPRVVATPHIGAQTIEAQARASVDIAQEVQAALQGKPLRWRAV